MRRIAVLLFALPFFASSLPAQTTDWTPLREAIAAELAETGIPGAAVAVIHDNEVAFAEGFGLADVAKKTAVTTQTRFRIGSVVKHFTAAAVVAQAQKGMVDLHAPIGNWLSDLPPRLGSLTLDQLLSHRGGVVDRLNEVKFSDDDIFAEPGSIFSYSSVGMSLAGKTAAAASGVSFDDLLTTTVLHPLGMTATSYEAQGGDATGYTLRRGRPRVAPLLDNADFKPAGMLYSTAADLSTYAIAFMSGKLDAELAAALSTERSTIPGDDRSYGYGTVLADEGGERTVSHMGDEYGGSAFLKMVPARGCAVVVLTNARGRLTRSMAAALRLACGVESYEDVRGETSPLTASEVAELTGRYDNYQWLEITRRGDRALFGPWLPWWGRWLPLRRDIVRYGTDDYGVTGIPGTKEPVRFHVVRAADGSIDHFVMMARAFKRRR